MLLAFSHQLSFELRCGDKAKPNASSPGKNTEAELTSQINTKQAELTKTHRSTLSTASVLSDVSSGASDFEDDRPDDHFYSSVRKAWATSDSGK